MAYCSTSAIYSILPKLPNTTTMSGYSQCAVTLDVHIRRTDGLINGKCARRYSVPFTSTAVPPFIRTIAEDITAYYMMRSFYSQDAQNKNDWVVEHKENALQFLDEIMKGEIDLVDTSGAAVPTQDEEIIDQVSSNTQEFQPFFDVDEPLEWEFNEDLLDEIDSARRAGFGSSRARHRKNRNTHAPHCQYFKENRYTTGGNSCYYIYRSGGKGHAY